MKPLTLSLLLSFCFTFLFIGIHCVAFGQDDGPGQPSEGTGFLPDTWAAANQIIPPSPGAASLGKFGNIPVNYYTGSPNINIPLYTIGGIKVSTTFALTYDANGLKVAALPSMVGWGWTLQGGGVITRTVRGLPDQEHNYYNYPGFAGLNLNSFRNTIEWNDFMLQVSCGNIEVQPDVYSFNIPGYSGSFIISPDKRVIQKEFQDLEITPRFFGNPTPGAAVNPGRMDQFTIKDPYGTEYKFEANEYTFFQDVLDTDGGRGFCEVTPVAEKYYYSSWYLTSITSADKKEELVFGYENIQEDYYQLRVNHAMDDSKSVSLGMAEQCGQPGQVSYSYGNANDGSNPKIYDRKHLKTVTFINGGVAMEKIEFNVTAVVEADPDKPQSSGIKLDDMRVHKKWMEPDFDPIGWDQTLAFRFEYYPDNPTNRLTLEKVTEQGFDAQTNTWELKPPYEFKYEGSVPADVTSNAIDHWGYYNGGGGSSLIPNVTLDCGTYGGGAGRNASFHKSGVLTKITYPTGGSTEFDFGMHRIKPDNARNCRELAAPIGANVGGFRINAITDRDETGAIASSRQFSYKNEDNTSSGKLMYALEYHQMTTNHHIPWENCAVINGTGQYDCDDYICGRVTIFANNTSKYASKAGPHIGYSRVVERTGSGGAIGKTAYEFTNEYPSTADIWDIYNGTLEAVKTYDSQDRIVREEYYIEPNTSTVAALNGCPDSPQRCFDEYHPFIIVADPDQTNQLVLCEMPNGQNRWIHEFDDNTGCLDHKIFYTKFIKYDHYAEQKWKRSTYKKTIDYSYSDLAPGTVEKTTLYEYNDPQIAKPTSTSFHNSDGKEHRTEIEYLHAGYINAIPKKTTKKVDGQITGGTYIDFDLVGRPLVLSEILKGGTILERGVIGGYNGFGRPISYKYMDFPTEEYTWTNGLLTQRQQLDWIWKYDYNEQRLLRKFTDIDGQESFYDYDGLLRLLHSSSRGGNVSVDYKYNYLLLNGGDNYVKTTEHYSDFQDQISKQTIDGLGRPLQTIKIGYGPHGEDVLTEDLDYDGHGRVVQKVYIPDEEGGLTYTTMTYEKSPLSRLLTETFPDGNKVVTEYGGTGNYYFTKSTDENGNGTTTKTDILGRQISKTDPLGGLTEYEYDNRNNLLKVTNPENQDYLFTYDNRNRMRTKKVPGADCTEFYFENGRDLMVASQDGNLREQGKWIATEYDPFGRVLRTGFYNHNAVIYCNLPAGQVPNEPNDFLPVPQDELTINIYDVESGATCDVNQNDNIFKGKLTATSARVLEEGGLTGWVDTKYCFDDFGRQVRTEISTPYGKDEYENDYNFADIVKASRRDFNSGELAYSHLNLIDHSGRITYSGFEGGGTSYKFNSKDQLVRKSLGGLAELNYMYNSRGWLTKINNMPFENTTGFPTCSANPPSGGSGSGGGLPCGECGEEELTLEQLLQVRFNKNLNVDCYLPCNCSNRCDPGAGLPCDSITIEGDTIIYPTDVKYPAELFDVLKCTGEEGLVLGDSLARILGNYAVRNRWKVENESQKFKVETAAYGEQIVDLQGLLDLAGEGADPTIKNPGQKSCTECPAADELPPCTSEQAGSQQAAINGIGANLIGSIDELRFPTNLVRVRLCDGSEIYLFDEELSLLEAGTYFTLQVIPLVDGNSEIVIGGAGENPTQMSLSGFLNVRNTLMFPMG